MVWAREEGEDILARQAPLSASLCRMVCLSSSSIDRAAQPSTLFKPLYRHACLIPPASLLASVPSPCDRMRV